MTLRTPLLPVLGLLALGGFVTSAAADDFHIGLSFGTGYARGLYDGYPAVVVNDYCPPVRAYRTVVPRHYYEPWPYRRATVCNAPVRRFYGSYYGDCGPRPVVKYRTAPRYHRSTKVYRRSYTVCEPRHHYARSHRVYVAPRHHYRGSPRIIHSPRGHHGVQRYHGSRCAPRVYRTHR